MSPKPREKVEHLLTTPRVLLLSSSVYISCIVVYCSYDTYIPRVLIVVFLDRLLTCTPRVLLCRAVVVVEEEPSFPFVYLITPTTSNLGT